MLRETPADALREEIEKINRFADELNSEAENVLEYQTATVSTTE